MRHAKGALQLAVAGVRHDATARARPEDTGVVVEFHRDDCKGGPVMRLTLDEARAFQRAFQSAVDEAHRRAKQAFREARAQ